MKKLSVLMSALVMALAFVACEKDDVKPVVKDLKVSSDAIEVVIDGEAVSVDVTGGVAPYEAEVAELAEGDTYTVTAKVDGGKVTIEAKTKEEPTPEAQEGEGEGEETPEPVVVEVTVTDAAEKTATIKVTVTEAEETPETPEGEE